MIGIKTKLDYSDYAGIPPDRNRYEIVDGDLLVTPAPSPLHQRVSKRLQRQLEAYFEARGEAEVFNAPIDLILGFHDVVQPDLVVVRDPAQISARGIEGPPLLVVEIISPSTRDQDRAIKARRYAAFGVPHYWMVDPERQGLECHRLASDGTYHRVVEAAGDTALVHPDWPGLDIRLGDFWR